MADQTVTAQVPFVFQVDGTVNDAGEVVADLRPSGVLAGAGMTATGEALLTAASAAAARTALSVSNQVAQVVYLPDVLAAGADVQKVVAPATGLLVSAALVLNDATATGACTATLDIDGVPVTDGVASVTGVSGTVGTATPSAANAVTAFTSVVGVTIGGANTQAGDGTLTLIYQLT